MATWGSWKAGDKAAGDGVSGQLRRPPSAPGHATRQPSRWRRNLVLAVLIGLCGWLAWSWHALREEALVGTALAARSGCECRFVSGRPLASCEAEIKASHPKGTVRAVSLSEEAASGTVRASVPLLASQSADFRPDRGCQLEPWRD